MQFKRLEIRRPQIPKKTYMYLVCLKEKYAKDFLKYGRIRFAEVSEWAELDDTDGKRGDRFEGVYASMEGVNEECYSFLKSFRKNSHSFQRYGKTYFYSDDIHKMRAYCMYGLSDTNVHIKEKRSPDHKYHEGGTIPASYFKGLFDTWTKDHYKESNDGEKPVVLMITPDKFSNLMFKRLKELGVQDSEIMYRPVNYLDYKGDTFICPSDKDELFQKHIDFKDQSEVRIVVDTTRDEVKQIFGKDGIIELGPIDQKVAFKLDFFFKDMEIEIRDNMMFFSLPESIHIPMSGPEPSLMAIQQTLADELPQSPMSIEEIENEVNRLAEILEKEYSIQYDKKNQEVFYQGQWQDIAKPAVEQMIAHYNNYISEGDWVAAHETIRKIQHFFPSYLDFIRNEKGVTIRELLNSTSAGQ